jgi:hypothetical protein
MDVYSGLNDYIVEVIMIIVYYMLAALVWLRDILNMGEHIQRGYVKDIDYKYT